MMKSIIAFQASLTLVGAFSVAPIPETIFPGVVDEAELLKESTFPIPPSELILRAKDVACHRGMGTRDNGKCLAENFLFRAQFVETTRTEYLAALSKFDLEEVFDVTQRFYNFHVDPFQPNRVWFLNRQTALQAKDFLGVTHNRNKELVLPPQTYHLDFDEEGKVTEFGFYTVDRAQGNTGGLGGVYAFLYGIGRGLPYPESQPYKRSWQRRLFETLFPLN